MVNMVMHQMTHLLHVGILNPYIAVCDRRIQSHQALLLQAQDNKIEDQDTECQDAAIQYPELADVMGQEIWDDQILPQHSYNRIPTICPGSMTQDSWLSNPHCNGDAQHRTADNARYVSSRSTCTNILDIVNSTCKVTCNKRIYGHRQGSSGSKQVQTNQPILRAVQVDVQIVLGVLNQLSCKKQIRESDQECSPATRLYMAMLKVAVLITSSSLMSRLRLLSSSMLMYSSVSWMYSAAFITMLLVG